MPEVLDIVQRINYEANTDAITTINDELGDQLKLIDESQKKIAKYEQQLSKLSDKEQASHKAIAALIEKEKRAIDGVNASIAKQIDGSNKLSNAVKKLEVNTNGVGVAFSNIVRDAPFGIIGIGNNITQLFDNISSSARNLRAQGATTGQVFAQLGASLLSFNTILSLGVTLLTVFSKDLFGTADAAKEANKELSDTEQFLKSFANTSAKELATFRQLTDVLEDNTQSYQDKKDAISELRKLYPEYFKDLTDEEILTNRATDAYNGVVEAIYRKARAQAGQEQLTKLIAREIELTEELGEIQKLSFNQDQSKFTLLTLEEEGKILKEKQRQAVIEKELEENRRKQSIYSKTIADNFERVTKTAKETAKTVKSARQGRPDDLISSLTPLSPTLANTDLPFGQASPQNALAIQKQQQEEEEKRRKKAQAILLEQARIVRDTLIGFIQDVLQAQIDALDTEIQVRQQRVQQGIELAKRGNTAVFEEENKRLEATQQKREEVAKRQLALNALLEASSLALVVAQSLQAVANAGASGDPYSAPIRIAATAAALVAAFGVVAKLVTASRGFKDGVIDLQGPGTGTSDSINARLSRGESVMTAMETRRYKPELMAMRAGTYQRGNSTSSLRLDTLESKMDSMIGAIKDNRFKQDVFFNEHGVGLMTSRAVNKDRKRWR